MVVSFVCFQAKRNPLALKYTSTQIVGVLVLCDNCILHTYENYMLCALSQTAQASHLYRPAFAALLNGMCAAIAECKCNAIQCNANAKSIASLCRVVTTRFCDQSVCMVWRVVDVISLAIIYMYITQGLPGIPGKCI